MRLLVIVLVGCGRIGFDATGDAAGSGRDGSVLAHNIVFATSNELATDFGGLDSADMLCMQHAMAGGLGGTFVAWLSTSTVDAASRLGQARGWVRPDGKPVADQLTDLLAGTIYYPIRLDEHGNDLATADLNVMTGTTAQGTYDATQPQCGDWTVAASTQTFRIGDVHRTTRDWTASATKNCATDKGRLYCFEVDYDNPLAVTPTSGRIAFVSRGTLDGAAGLGAADALCASEAAGLFPGTFEALLSTDTQSAASRFDAGGPTWVRPDGIPLAATAQQALASTFDAPIGVQADGTYVASRVWNGSVVPTATAASTNDDCTSWSTAASTSMAIVGASVSTTSGWDETHDGCDRSQAVYCLQL